MTMEERQRHRERFSTFLEDTKFPTNFILSVDAYKGLVEAISDASYSKKHTTSRPDLKHQRETKTNDEW
jgi:hypothetical protein